MEKGKEEEIKQYREQYAHILKFMRFDSYRITKEIMDEKEILEEKYAVVRTTYA